MIVSSILPSSTTFKTFRLGWTDWSDQGKDETYWDGKHPCTRWYPDCNRQQQQKTGSSSGNIPGCYGRGTQIV